MAVEAISRGAMLGTCVERSARMCTVLKGNMELCGIKDGHFEIAEAEMVPFLKSAARRRRRWDVVFLDPPADSDYDEPLSYLGRGTAVRQGGAVLIEHPAEMFFPDRIGVLKRFRVVTADGTAVSFYERR
jgi:16S rRNA G966 N2-methylase RsmD